jgi:hypothetical protein
LNFNTTQPTTLALGATPDLKLTKENKKIEERAREATKDTSGGSWLRRIYRCIYGSCFMVDCSAELVVEVRR